MFLFFLWRLDELLKVELRIRAKVSKQNPSDVAVFFDQLIAQ